MPPALAYAPAPEVDLLAAYRRALRPARVDRGQPAQGRANVPAPLARPAGLGRRAAGFAVGGCRSPPGRS